MLKRFPCQRRIERGGTISAPLTALMVQLSLLHSTCGPVRGNTDGVFERRGVDAFLQTLLFVALYFFPQPRQDSNRWVRSGWASKGGCDRRFSSRISNRFHLELCCLPFSPKERDERISTRPNVRHAFVSPSFFFSPPSPPSSIPRTTFKLTEHDPRRCQQFPGLGRSETNSL